jgi:RimJ/RimL family protein N-acetyltransferase
VAKYLTKAGNLYKLFMEKGFVGLWDRFLFWAWRTREYVALDKIINNEVVENINNIISFRVAEEDDIPWICNNMEQLGEMVEEIIRQQFTGNDLTIIGTTKEQPDILAFSVWLSHNDRAFPLLDKAVAPGEVSVRRVWVPPIMRKKGFATLGMEFFEYAAFSAGIRKIWSFVETDNVNSILLHEKLNYNKYAIITIKKRFGRAYAKTITCAKSETITTALPPERTKL